jgi:hypothetical protein
MPRSITTFPCSRSDTTIAVDVAQRAISGADFSYDDLGRIPAPVDAAVALAHEGAKTTANILPVVIERLGLKMTRFKFFDRLQDAADSCFGDLMAV